MIDNIGEGKLLLYCCEVKIPKPSVALHGVRLMPEPQEGQQLQCTVDARFSSKQSVLQLTAFLMFFQVTCSEQKEFSYPSKNISLHFEVPVDYGVEIDVRGDANVDVRDLEGWLYEIITDQGSCDLKNLRGSRLSVETNGGDIKCESQLLFEFGILDAKKKGNISVKKLQGKKFCVDTEDGDIDIGATYLLRAELTSNKGHVRLGDIHGEFLLLLLSIQ